MKRTCNEQIVTPWQTLSVRGRWWSPDRPDDCVAGCLTFDSVNGATLELDDAFKRSIPELMECRPEILLGVSVSGVPYTALYCGQAGLATGISFTDRTPRIKQLFFTPLAILEGMHIASVSDPLFGSIELRFNHLTTWVDQSHVISDLESGHIRLEKFPPVSLGQIGLVNVMLHNEPNFLSWDGRPLREDSQFIIRQRAGLTCQSSQPLSFLDWTGFIARCQRFFSFSIGTSVYPTEIFNNVSPALTDPCPSREPIVNLYYKTHAVRGAKCQPRFDMLVRFDCLGIESESLLNHWDMLENQLSHIVDLYLGNVFSDSLNPVFYFLSVAQALESFHRIKHGGSALPKAEYRALRNRILSILPDDDRTWLCEKFPFNEKTFAVRLAELCTIYGESLFPSLEVQDQFVRDMKLHRNYYTHYEWHDKKAQLRTDGLLIELAEHAKMLLDACILAELGFTPEKRTWLLYHHMSYYRLLGHVDLNLPPTPEMT